MDAFSEILATTKLQGALFFRGEFSASWFIDSPSSQILAPVLAPGASHLVVFHLLIEGAAKVRLHDDRTRELVAGDIVVFPHGDAHNMMSLDGNCQVRTRP